MGRLLILVVAVFALLWLVRRALRSGSPRRPKDAAAQVPALVRCAHCATHVPAEEAIQRGTQTFCSEAHARLGASSERE